jgi:hypothetical protein
VLAYPTSTPNFHVGRDCEEARVSKQPPEEHRLEKKQTESEELDKNQSTKGTYSVCPLASSWLTSTGVIRLPRTPCSTPPYLSKPDSNVSFTVDYLCRAENITPSEAVHENFSTTEPQCEIQAGQLIPRPFTAKNQSLLHAFIKQAGALGLPGRFGLTIFFSMLVSAGGPETGNSAHDGGGHFIFNSVGAASYPIFVTVIFFIMHALAKHAGRKHGPQEESVYYHVQVFASAVIYLQAFTNPEATFLELTTYSTPPTYCVHII